MAREAGFAIANSNLFKTAVYGCNPNWGRIIQALGQAGIAVDKRLTIKAGSLKGRSVTLVVDLKQGKHSRTVYTSDLSPKYIKINAEYS
jgi:glutamate N-acetyltransferase/amino-acid N-acetyltransferase